jgi:hypothetical protein
MLSSPHIILRKLLQEINNTNNNINHPNLNEHDLNKNHAMQASTPGAHVNHTAQVLSNSHSHPDKAIKEVINVITKKTKSI